MNSNSSSPFVGLELSVDAGDTNSGTLATDGTMRNGGRASASLRAAAANDDGPTLRFAAIDGVSRNFVKTSQLRQDTGNLKYALPAVDLNKDPRQAAEVREIMERLSGS
ncbi:MAG: hypothetical protein ABGZ53_16635 [Fuerstiella sp.]